MRIEWLRRSILDLFIKNRTTQPFDAHRLFGQDVFDMLGKQPAHRRHQLASRSSASPTIIEVSPKNRICPSESSIRRRKVSRQVSGARKGSNPSITSTRAKAMSSVVPMAHYFLAPALPAASLRYLKKSEFGSSSSRSDLERKLDL